MNFNDILNSQISEASNTNDQARKCLDLVIKNTSKLLKVLDFANKYDNVIELKKQLTNISSQDVIPFIRDAEYELSKYDNEYIQKLTGNKGNNIICYFNGDKFKGIKSYYDISDELTNETQLNLTVIIKICESIIGLNKLFSFIGKKFIDVKSMDELKNFYKTYSDIDFIAANGEKYNVKFSGRQCDLIVNGERIFFIGTNVIGNDILGDLKNNKQYMINGINPENYNKTLSASNVKLAEDVLKLLKTKLFFNDVKDVKNRKEILKQILIANNIELFNFDPKDARYIFVEAIKDTFKQEHDRNIFFNNIDIKCERDNELNYVLKVNIVAKFNPPL